MDGSTACAAALPACESWICRWEPERCSAAADAGADVEDDAASASSSGIRQEADPEPTGPRLPAGLLGPVFRVRAELAPGQTLICSAAGTGAGAGSLDLDVVARYFLRSRGAAGLGLKTLQPGSEVATAAWPSATLSW